MIACFTPSRSSGHAVHRLAAGEQAGQVAAELDSADQSHLHREVMEFTGLTPATVAGEPWLSVDDIAWAAGQRGMSARHLPESNRSSRSR